MIEEFNTVVQLEKEWKQISSQNNINYCQSYSWTRYTEIFCSSNFFKRLYFGKIKYFALYLFYVLSLLIYISIVINLQEINTNIMNVSYLIGN